jgi:hypothetical protein
MTNNLKDTQAAVEEVLPKECELTKIELEGPQIVLYLKNIRAFYADENLITRIAARLRKRILLRCDASCLMTVEKALPLIKSIIPVEAGVTDVRFDVPFNEVLIEAAKPGIAIGKGGVVLKQIMLETGWSPRVLRAPTKPSEVVKAIRLGMLANSEDRRKFLINLGKKIVSPSKTCDWIKLTALGGFKEVGRSCMLLQTPESNMIIDCGLNTDTSDASRAYPYLNTTGLALDDIDAVILTHAHLDHSGFVPYLYAYGYDGPTYTTSATRDLSALLQRDCVKVMHSETGEAPYAEKDIRTQLNHVITREYHEVTDIAPDVRFTFYNSGHILGGAIVHLHIGEGLHNLVITSDMKYGRTNLLEQAETNFPRVETLVMESTYGSREDIQPRLIEGETRLTNIIRRTIEQRGKVLIPVFAVGRAQEVMLVLERYLSEENIPMYLDGMSLEASAIHTVYPEYLRKNVQRRILQNDSPFDKPIFRSMVGKDRKEVVESEEPCVILAPSGMLSGGPSVQFFRLLAPDPKNALVFVGYQAAMSLGRRIQSGAREVPVLDEAHKLDSVKVNMGIYTVDSFSGHSDYNQLLAFARNLRPKPDRIFTMHGDNSKCEELARTLSRMIRCEARAPLNLDSIRLK